MRARLSSTSSSRRAQLAAQARDLDREGRGAQRRRPAGPGRACEPRVVDHQARGASPRPTAVTAVTRARRRRRRRRRRRGPRRSPAPGSQTSRRSPGSPRAVAQHASMPSGRGLARRARGRRRRRPVPRPAARSRSKRRSTARCRRRRSGSNASAAATAATAAPAVEPPPRGSATSSGHADGAGGQHEGQGDPRDRAADDPVERRRGRAAAWPRRPRRRGRRTRPGTG